MSNNSGNIEVSGGQFEVGSVIPSPAKFIGREEELRTIKLRLLRMENVSIVGERRIGKTSLLIQIKQSFGLDPAFGKYVFCYLSLESIFGMKLTRIADEFIRSVNDSQSLEKQFVLKSGSNGLTRPLVEMATHFQGDQIVLLLDEFDQIKENLLVYEEFLSSLRAAFNQTTNLAIVTTSRIPLQEIEEYKDKRSSPFFNIFRKTIILTLFSEKEASQLIKKYSFLAGEPPIWPRILLENIDHLKRITGFHPFFFQMALQIIHELREQDYLNSPIHWEKVIKEFKESSSGHFDYYWKVSTIEEKILLRRISNSRRFSISGNNIQRIERLSVQDLVGRGILRIEGLLNDRFAIFSEHFGEWILNVSSAAEKRNLHDWNRAIGVDFREFFQALIRFIGYSTFRINPAYSILEDSYFSPNTKRYAQPELGVYSNILKAAWETMAELTTENTAIITQSSPEFESLLDQINSQFEFLPLNSDHAIDETINSSLKPLFRKLDRKTEQLDLGFLEGRDQLLEIDSHTFSLGRNLAISAEFSKIFTRLLSEVIELPRGISNALGQRFGILFHYRFLDLISDRKDLIEWFAENDHSAERKQKRIDRLVYNNRLQNAPNEPVFDEAFSMDSIYIPPRGLFIKETFVGEKEPVILDAERFIVDWINSSQAESSILILLGGPGSGKTVLLRRIAAQVSLSGDSLVYFIPMSQLSYSGSAKDSIIEYIQSHKLLYRENPFAKGTQEEQEDVLFLLDGIDELSLASESTLRQAQQFLYDLSSLVSNENRNYSRIKIVVSGRDLAFSAIRGSQRKNFIEIRLLSFDERQRNSWWEKYSQAKDLDGVPTIIQESSRFELEEVLEVPLLNYLFARTLEVENEYQSSSIDLNQIYDTLISGVFNQESSQSENLWLDRDEFQFLFEEIAISGWQAGDVRRASMNKFKRRASHSGLGRLWMKFGDTEFSTFNKLLVSFYFSKAEEGRNSGEGIIEFTHKSFGEYFVAKRIVREIDSLHNGLKRSNDKFTEYLGPSQALERWIDLCGPSEMGESIWGFINREIELLCKTQKSVEWAIDVSRTFADLLDHAINIGFPLTRENNSLLDVSMKGRNAEESLFLCTTIFARIVDRPVKVDWRTAFGAGQWFSRLCGQFGGGGETIFIGINHLDFTRQDLSGKVFDGANAESSVFTDSNLKCIRSRHGNFKKGRFEYSSIEYAVFESTDFSHCSFEFANLEHAHFLYCNLEACNFNSSNLSGANFHGVRAQNSNFRSANLTESDISGGDFRNSDFRGALLDGIKIDRKTLLPKKFREVVSITYALVEGKRLSAGDLADFLDTISFR